MGLHRLKVRAGPSRRLIRVVVKADSEYLVKAMTVGIRKWRDNGYVNCQGLPVTNTDLFQQIDASINELNQMDVEVQFWHIRTEDNREADCLANAALDGVGAEDAMNGFFNR